MQPRSESVSGHSVCEAGSRKPCALWSHLHPHKEGMPIGEAGSPAPLLLRDQAFGEGWEPTVTSVPPEDCVAFGVWNHQCAPGYPGALSLAQRWMQTSL